MSIHDHELPLPAISFKHLIKLLTVSESACHFGLQIGSRNLREKWQRTALLYRD